MKHQMTFKFEVEDDNGLQIESALVTNATSLDEILRQFEDFLRGCSFKFDGHVGIVEEDSE